MSHCGFCGAPAGRTNWPHCPTSQGIDVAARIARAAADVRRVNARAVRLADRHVAVGHLMRGDAATTRAWHRLL